MENRISQSEGKKEEYFLWNREDRPSIFVCAGREGNEYLWKMIYSCKNPDLAGAIYRNRISPEQYIALGIEVISRTEAAIIKLRGI